MSMLSLKSPNASEDVTASLVQASALNVSMAVTMAPTSAGNVSLGATSTGLIIPPSLTGKTSQHIEKRVWSTEEGEMLLDLYDANKERFKDPSIRKIGVWAEICDAINQRFNSDFTPERCHQKLRNFKNDFQKVIMLEKKDCRHFERLHRIFLQSSDRPLQSPAALKRKLSQLAGPKMPGADYTSPEKKSKIILPDFRSRKSRGGNSFEMLESASVSRKMAQKQNVNSSKKNSGRKNPRPEKKRILIIKDRPMSPSNSSLSPIYVNTQAGDENRGNSSKFAGYLSIPPEHTMVAYPHLQSSKPYEMDAIRSNMEGYADNRFIVSQSPVVAEIRRAECVPGSRISVPQDYYESYPVVCKIEEDEEEYHEEQYSKSSTASDTRNDLQNKILLQDQHVNARRAEVVYDSEATVSRERSYLESQARTSQVRIGSRLDEPQIQPLVLEQDRNGLPSIASRPLHSQAAETSQTETSPTSDRVIVSQSQDKETTEVRSDDAVGGKTNHSKNHTISKVRIASPESLNAETNRPLMNAVNRTRSVTENHFYTDDVPQGSSVGTINNVRADYGRSLNRREIHENSPQQKTYLYHQPQALYSNSQKHIEDSVINRNIADNRRQQAKKSHSESQSVEYVVSKLHEKERSLGSTNHAVIDLTEKSALEQEQLSRIADCIDNWRKEYKLREEALIEREKAREKRMEEMHQETLNITTKFVKLFETFVTKVGETGDQVY